MSTTMWMSMTWLQTCVISFDYGWTRTYLWREHLPPLPSLLRNLKHNNVLNGSAVDEYDRTVITKSNFKRASNEYRELNTCTYSLVSRISYEVRRFKWSDNCRYLPFKLHGCLTWDVLNMTILESFETQNKHNCSLPSACLKSSVWFTSEPEIFLELCKQ